MQRLALLISLFACTVLGGIVFRDIRPQSYFPDRRLYILSGKLFSPELALSKEFYMLNYCISTNMRGYNDELVN